MCAVKLGLGTWPGTFSVSYCNVKLANASHFQIYLFHCSKKFVPHLVSKEIHSNLSNSELLWWSMAVIVIFYMVVRQTAFLSIFLIWKEILHTLKDCLSLN